MDSSNAFSAKRLFLGGTSAWYVPAHLEPIRKVAMSTHTEVVTFMDRQCGGVVSVKKVKDALQNMGDAQRLLREIKVLRSAQHENLLAIVDVYAPSGLADVYVVTPAMKSSLQRVMCSRQDLSLEHRQYLMHQLMRGLFHLHSAGVIHRDLRPSNILVNTDSTIRISNFGLARCREEEEGVSACEYRAPELLLGSRYTSAVDVWSAGCILGELAAGAPLFGGRDNLDQIRRILQVLGRMPEQEFDWIPNSGKDLLRTAASSGSPVRWVDRLPGASPAELQLVGSMLVFKPERRLTAKQVLRQPYFSHLHSKQHDELKAHCKFDWSFDRLALTDAEIRRHFDAECRVFRPAAPTLLGTQILTPKRPSPLQETQGEGFMVVTPSNRFDNSGRQRLSPASVCSVNSRRSVNSYSPLSSPNGSAASPSNSPAVSPLNSLLTRLGGLREEQDTGSRGLFPESDVPDEPRVRGDRKHSRDSGSRSRSLSPASEVGERRPAKSGVASIMSRRREPNKR